MRITQATPGPRTWARAVGVLLVASVMATTAVAPANAASSTIRDKRGDAPASLDIRTAKVTVSRSRITATISVRDLRSRGAFALSVYQATEDFDTYRLHLTGWKTGRGKAESRVGYYDFVGVAGEGSDRYFVDRGCRSSVTWDAKRDRVRLSFAREGCRGLDPSVPVEVRVLSSRRVSDVDNERRVTDRTSTKKFRA